MKITQNVESFTASGLVTLTLHDVNGNIKETKTIKNLVVSTGKSWIVSRMLNTSNPVMSHMGIGTGNVAANSSDSILGQQVARVAFVDVTSSQNQITYSATFPAGVGSGAITEAGIFNQSSAGTMLCRTVFNPVNKDVLDTLTINWTVTII
jgi:uncharacterized membrane protein